MCVIRIEYRIISLLPPKNMEKYFKYNLNDFKEQICWKKKIFLRLFFRVFEITF